MCAEEATISMVTDEALDPSPPTLVQLPDDGPTAAAAGSISRSSEPPNTVNCRPLREQLHLEAAENSVYNALQQVMESVETRLLEALRQAAIDIIENLGKEAAGYLMLSAHKAALLDHQLNYTKQQAFAMLMRLKQVSDAQIFDAEKQTLFERRRAQEAEAKLYAAQESNKQLKAELKREGQLWEDLQKQTYPIAAEQGIQVGFTNGSESRKGEHILNGFAGEKHPLQTASIPSKPVTSPGLTTFRCSVKGSIVEVHTANNRPLPPLHSVTYRDAYTASRVQLGLPGTEVLQPGTSNLLAEGGLSLTGHCHLTIEGLHGQQESKANENVSVRGSDKISVKVHQPHCLSENCHLNSNQAAGSPYLREKDQLLSLKVDSDLRAAKDSDEEKSFLTLEALYCNDESLLTQLQLVEEYQSNVYNLNLEQQPSDGPKYLFSARDREASADFTKQLGAGEDPDGAKETFSNASIFSQINEGRDKLTSSSLFKQSGAVTKEMRELSRIQESILGLGKAVLDFDEGRDSMHGAVAEEAALKIVLASPVFAEPNSDEPVASSPVVNAVPKYSGSQCPIEDAYRPQSQNESNSNQVLRRKRKQGVSKYDYVVTDSNSKRLEEESAVTGAFDLLAAAGVDGQISLRDSRRLIQGACQLFSLAERNWR